MSSHNIKFVCALLTASIILVFSIDEAIGQPTSLPELPLETLVFEPPPLPCQSRNEFQLYDNGTYKDCDCLPYNFRYVEDDSCYKPYIQGPCETGKYLVLPENKEKLECVDDPGADK